MYRKIPYQKWFGHNSWQHGFIGLFCAIIFMALVIFSNTQTFFMSLWTNVLAVNNIKLASQEISSVHVREFQDVVGDMDNRLARQRAYRIWLQEGPRNAIQYLHSLPHELQEQPMLRFYLGLFELENKNLYMASEIFRTIPNAYSFLVNKGRYHYHLEHWDEAIKWFQVALHVHPNSSETWIEIGRAYQSQGNSLTAVDAYEKALSFDPDESTAYYELGALFESAGDLEEAIWQYNQAIEKSLEPNRIALLSYQGLVRAQETRGAISEAVEINRKGLERFPNDRYLSYRLGHLLLYQDRVLEAIALYRQAIEGDPEYAHYHFGLGKALFERADYGNAVLSFSKATDIDMDNKAYYFWLGRALEKAGNNQQAARAYCDAWRLDVNWVMPADAFEHLAAEGVVSDTCQLKP